MNSTEPTPQSEWRLKVLAYASGVNAFVEKGQRDGWEDAGDEPEHQAMEHLLGAWRDALESINRPGATASERDAFREAWPPSHWALIPQLDANGVHIGPLALLDDGRIAARIGAPYEDGHIVVLSDGTAEPFHAHGAFNFGRCPQRRHFALATPDGVVVTEGWNGPVTCRLAWPTGLEGLPDGAAGEVPKAWTPTQLIPFPGGHRVLLVSADGIFVLASGGARRVLPTTDEMTEALADGSFEPEDVPWGLDMDHGAISPDGRWVAVGQQSGSHKVFDGELNLVASIGPVGEYPHFALFNTRGDHAIFNACHFYNGGTLGVSVADLPGLDTDFYADDPRTPTLQQGARVYAGAHRGDEYIVGDAHGYVRAFSESGDERWQLFIGSTVGGIDVSADGRTLVVATCAGFVSVIQLDDERGPAPWQIGTGPHRELRRWVIWRGIERPLLW